MDIDIKPKLNVLNSLGLSRAEFDHALELALDRLDGTPKQELPPPTGIPLILRGEERCLGDVASIALNFGPGRPTVWL